MSAELAGRCGLVRIRVRVRARVRVRVSVRVRVRLRLRVRVRVRVRSPSTHESNRRAVVLAGHATAASLAGSPGQG